MCIYCTTTNYRKIWTEHNGPIPRDEMGRSYHIHHRDRNRKNNNLNNLQCVSLQEHYDIHLSQGDMAACLRLAVLLKLSGEEISRLANEASRKRVENGTHHLLGGEISGRSSRKRVADGTHNFLGGEISKRTAKRKVEDGTHHFLGPAVNRKRIEEGTHIFLDPEFQELARQATLKRVEDGTHPFLGGEIQRKRIADGTHHMLGGDIQRKNMAARLAKGLPAFLGDPDKQRAVQKKLIAEGNHCSQKEHECPHCGKIGRGNTMFRNHFDKCKSKK